MNRLRVEPFFCCRQEDGRELQFIGMSLFLLLQQGARNPSVRC
jgi:hypothetical protein